MGGQEHCEWTGTLLVDGTLWVDRNTIGRQEHYVGGQEHYLLTGTLWVDRFTTGRQEHCGWTATLSRKQIYL